MKFRQRLGVRGVNLLHAYLDVKRNAIMESNAVFQRPQTWRHTVNMVTQTRGQLSELGLFCRTVSVLTLSHNYNTGISHAVASGVWADTFDLVFRKIWLLRCRFALIIGLSVRTA